LFNRPKPPRDLSPAESQGHIPDARRPAIPWLLRRAHRSECGGAETHRGGHDRPGCVPVKRAL